MVLPGWLRVLLVLAAVAWARENGAQQVPIVRLTAENDYFNFFVPPDRRPDYDYTHGTRMIMGAHRVVGWGFLAPELRACGAAASAERCGATTWEIGQLIFTPIVDASTPIPGERPYAGWLYGTMTARLEERRRLRSAFVTLGITGPPSLAENAYVGVHRLVLSYRPTAGWAHQLPTEIAGAVGARDAWLVTEARVGQRRAADIVAAWGAQLGTVRTSASASLRARVGHAISHPWRADPAAPALEAFLLAGARVEGVARDLFLDGSTFHDGPRVDRSPVTGSAEWGVGARVARVALEYRLVTHAREYATGPAQHRVGVLSVSLLP